MDEKEKLDNLTREQNELRQMINSGVTFDVDITYKKRKPGLLGFIRTDGEVAFDGVDSAPGESVHFGLRPKCQAAIGRNVGALYRIEVGAVVLIVVGAYQKLPLLVPVGDSRRVGVDRGMLA